MGLMPMSPNTRPRDFTVPLNFDLISNMGAAVYPFRGESISFARRYSMEEQLRVSGQTILPIFWGKCKLKRAPYRVEPPYVFSDPLIFLLPSLKFRQPLPEDQLRKALYLGYV